MPARTIVDELLSADPDNVLLQRIATDQEFTRSVINIAAIVAEIWEAPQHPFYTGHDPAHSVRVLRYLGRLVARLPDDYRLSAGEIYILVAAAYLHDIGMQRYITGRTPEQIRDEHAELGATWIIESVADPPRARDVGILKHYAELIAQVTRGHRAKDLNNPAYRDRRLSPYPKPIRIAFLSALLQLADELDLTYERVSMPRMSYQEVPADSQVHWYRHNFITDVDIDPHEGHIRLTFVFPPEHKDDYADLIAAPLEELLAAKMANLRLPLRSNDIRFDLVLPELETSIAAQSLSPEAVRELQKAAESRHAERQEQLALQAAREG